MWYMLKNCSETTKLEMLIRLIGYFTTSRNSSFPEKEFDFEKLFKEMETWDGKQGDDQKSPGLRRRPANQPDAGRACPFL